MEQQIGRMNADARFRAIGRVMSGNPEHANFGCIGPDMLFWADWGKFTPYVTALFDIYGKLDEIYDKLMAIWQPVQDHIDRLDRTLNALSGGLVNDVRQTTDQISAIINTALLKLITDQLNYYSILKPEFQKNNVDEGSWNWLDFTHHRRTGQFAKALIDNANTSASDSLKAYALGWLSHVTADVVGHAYVNMAVGGPWRTHYQRHHIQENFMDVWTWGFYHTSGVSMPTTAAPGTIPFNYASFRNVGSANLQEKINLGDDLPDDLAQLIATSLDQVYNDNNRVRHPEVIGTFLGAGRNQPGLQDAAESAQDHDGPRSFSGAAAGAGAAQR